MTAQPAATGAAAAETGSDGPGVGAYILVQTEVGRASAVTLAIREISEVTGAEAVSGPYDVVVHASASSVDELGRLVVARIQAIPGITRTLLCVVVNI